MPGGVSQYEMEERKKINECEADGRTWKENHSSVDEYSLILTTISKKTKFSNAKTNKFEFIFRTCKQKYSNMEKKFEHVFRTCKQKMLSLEGGDKTKCQNILVGPKIGIRVTKKAHSLPYQIVLFCVDAITFYYILQSSNVSVRRYCNDVNTFLEI